MANLSIPRTSGIYRILCIPTGKIYIGSAVNLYKRWQNHRCNLRGNRHPNSHLQRAWQKYGEQAFTFEVIEECEPDRLLEREQFLLDTIRPYGKKVGFNIATDALAPMRGRLQTPEHRAKSSAAKKGRKLSPEHIDRVAAARRGMKHKPESCAKISAANKGKKRSPETRAKIIVALTGRKVSVATRNKISASNKGHIGVIHTPETRERIRIANSKTYVVISPDGREWEIEGLRKFCREHNLSNGAICEVSQGKRKHYKGWKVRRIDPNAGDD